MSEEENLHYGLKREPENNGIVPSGTKKSDMEDEKVDEVDPQPIDNTKVETPLNDDNVAKTKSTDDDALKPEEDSDWLGFEADNKSLRSLVKVSSRDSMLTTTESVKEIHGELRIFTSYEDLKVSSIESKESLRSHTDISEKTASDSESQPVESALKRAEMIEQYRNLLAERRQLMLKNILLQKKLHDYFKKKKAEGMYHESESVLAALGDGQAELHYRRNLLVFEDALEKDAHERARIMSESRELLQRKNELLDDATTQVDSLLKQEEIFGHGLINSSTGKALSEKVVLSLINRQTQITKQLTEIMLKYIRVRDEVYEKETAIKALEDLGEGLHLIDYEQLCVEKRALYDKIEERDNELSRLREKIETSILALSHLHERTYDTDQMIESNLHRLNELTHLVQMSREKRTKAKKHLIHVRNEIEHLQHEAGLLVHHSLLRDFENVLIHTAEVEDEVNQMKKNILWDKKLSVTSEESNVSERSNGETTSSSNLGSTTASYIKKGKRTKQSSDKSRGKKYMQQSKMLHASDQSHPQIYKGRPSIVKFLSTAYDSMLEPVEPTDKGKVQFEATATSSETVFDCVIEKLRPTPFSTLSFSDKYKLTENGQPKHILNIKTTLL